MRRRRLALLLEVVWCSPLIICFGCGHSAAPPTQTSAPASPPAPLTGAAPEMADMPASPPIEAVVEQIEKVDIGAASPAHQIGRYYLAGQPAAADMPDLHERGIRTVISLRTPGEIDWDEKAAVEAAGMKFVSIPFRGADSLGDSQIEAALKELADEANGPILLHCGTSNRVGAIWYAHRIRHDGLTPEEAMAEAKEVGLRNGALTDVVNAYCEKQPATK